MKEVSDVYESRYDASITEYQGPRNQYGENFFGNSSQLVFIYNYRPENMKLPVIESK